MGLACSKSPVTWAGVPAPPPPDNWSFCFFSILIEADARMVGMVEVPAGVSVAGMDCLV